MRAGDRETRTGSTCLYVLQGSACRSQSRLQVTVPPLSDQLQRPWKGCHKAAKTWHKETRGRSQELWYRQIRRSPF